MANVWVTLGPIANNITRIQKQLEASGCLSLHPTEGINSEKQSARAVTSGLWNLLSVACPLVTDVSRNEPLRVCLPEYS